MSLIQARARLETIVVDPIELDSRDALNIARVNRLDYMNNRAALVDSWRLIEFADRAAFKIDVSSGTARLIKAERSAEIPEPGELFK